MNDPAHQDLPADEQLRQALNGFAAVFESLLRRCSEYDAAIEQFRARQQTESDRIAALERSLASDRSALERMRGVFAEMARLGTPTANASALETTARAEQQQEPRGLASAPTGHLSSPFPRQATEKS
jgi:hypothetical protein